MSLVQDYAALLEGEVAGQAFDAIFSLQPKPAVTADADTPLLGHFPVVDCDPTQTRAVVRARDGRSYIIQGPPGTGKSQTITNLIADYVARGKRVLFVCEKRAAIDVVFHRLGRQGLDELCCLIHDSQTDKRDFIRNLRQTYEKFLNQPLDESLEPRRAEVVRQIELELAALRRWTTALEAHVADASLTVRGLLERLVDLRSHAVDLDPLTFEQVPPYALWRPHAGVVRSLSTALRRLGGDGTLARHSFRHLTERALTSPQPLATITAAADESDALLAKIGRALSGADETVAAKTLSDLDAVIALAAKLAPVAAADALELLNARSTRARKTAKAVRDWRAAQKTTEKAREANSAWRDRLPPTDTAAALNLARRLESSVLRWVAPAFWRLRSVLRARYDFAQHAVPRSWVQILSELQAEHAAAEAEATARGVVEEAMGDLDAEVGVALLEQPASDRDTLPQAAQSFYAYLVENPEAAYFVENLAALQPAMTRLRDALGLVVGDYPTMTRDELTVELARLRQDLVWLPDVLPLLAEALQLPEPLQRALRRLPLTDQQLESAMARKSLAASYRADRTFEATDGRIIATRVARMEASYREWLQLNAQWIHQRVRREFLRKVQLASTPAAQLTDDEKELKRLYGTGRRELEHEFSKTMRHRSIRDLADDETGVVLRDLKPVWLMSPLSISDTLPLSVDAFDVVIFDEASQIPVEEAIPAVFRGGQAIVVGDEMQLPPTNFFSATRLDDEPLGEDALAASVAEDLDADSFLTQSARNLPSTMLGWHYRSRYESLISFSNHAFYEARLLTIPACQGANGFAGEIIAKAPADGAANVDALLARSVSFHFHPDAVYEQRRNAAEADYIAHLVRELLVRKTRLSIGIVAFSEAQQGEIEGALGRLSSEDAAFRHQLEAEYEREEEGQFWGLFVKNLENVQGDERDVIILSICYGYDRNRRMLMNFGPINQRGGEKRLNVIFSRARLHMAVVSSIRHFDITNDYNDGANCLRSFLEYASACSTGDSATSRRVLNAATGARNVAEAGRASETIAMEIATALRDRGLCVEDNVGQSSFRIPITLRRTLRDPHPLAVLIDNVEHYAQTDLLERYLLRPGVLRAFGWRTVMVFTKDWYHDPSGVIKRIEEALDCTEAPAADPKQESPQELTASQYEAMVMVAEIEPSADGVQSAAAALIEVSPEASSWPQEPVAVESRPVEELITPPPPANPRVSDPAEAARLPNPARPRRFTCTEDGANKFWEISINGVELTVHFGRIGTKGQAHLKTFASPEAAAHERDRLIRSKLAKGYVETAGADA